MTSLSAPAAQPGLRTDEPAVLVWGTVASLALTLASSIVYTLAGWDDALAALLHVLGGGLGGLLVVRLAAALRGPLAAAVLVLGMLGVAGVVGYGFNTIGIAAGGVDLIDAAGVGQVLKPLGLLWPLTLLVAGIGLLRRIPVAQAVVVIVAAVAYPVSRIANIGWLAIVVDAALLAALTRLPLREPAAR
ncbi:hypothetical protein [Pseudonocardia pini]|uniref:hypothetical protein n=1 Tax=Pseudonocardia pini TaxID=2758030 RepID=UPI0015EFE57A|nr:hypothetical protein [Pseudonocardia pini]